MANQFTAIASQFSLRSLANEIGFDGNAGGGDDDGGARKKCKGKGCGPDDNPNRPFDQLCAEGHLSGVILQWAQGVDIHQRSGNGATPLMWASFKGQAPVMRFLLDKGAAVSSALPDGQNALLWCAAEGHLEAGRILLEAGIRWDATDELGYTAAMIAVQNGHIEFLHMLNLHGAVSPTAVDRDGHTLLVWAAYRGDAHTLRYCHEVLGIGVAPLDRYKRNGLHWAAREGHAECCVELLAAGLNPNQPDDDGVTPLQHAITRRHRECAAVLSQNVTQPIDRCRGTLQTIAGDKWALLHALYGFGNVILHFAWSVWTPPFIAHWGVGPLLYKNIVWTAIEKRPTTANSSNLSMKDEIGMPPTLVEAFRGVDWARKRETCNIFALLAFLAVQYMVFSAAELPVPGFYVPMGFVLVLAVVSTKHFAYHAVVPNGTVKEDPLLKAVERREYNSLHPRVFCPRLHLRIPLRAYYCHEVDRVFHRFDCWSSLIDAPVCESNHRSFVLALVSFFAMQLATLVYAWRHYDAKLCTPENGVPPGFSALRIVFSLLFSALPCRALPHEKEWLPWLLGCKDNLAGLWFIVYPLTLLGIVGAVLFRQLQTLSTGITRAEKLETLAPMVNGELVSIMKGPGRPIYSEGGPVQNLLLFALGKSGERFRGVNALPTTTGPVVDWRENQRQEGIAAMQHRARATQGGHGHSHGH